MAGLKNKSADMEIGYVNIGNKFLKMLEKWDEAGGGDE